MNQHNTLGCLWGRGVGVIDDGAFSLPDRTEDKLQILYVCRMTWHRLAFRLTITSARSRLLTLYLDFTLLLPAGHADWLQQGPCSRIPVAGRVCTVCVCVCDAQPMCNRAHMPCRQWYTTQSQPWRRTWWRDCERGIEFRCAYRYRSASPSPLLRDDLDG